jgi:hypothetical protein
LEDSPLIKGNLVKANWSLLSTVNIYVPTTIMWVVSRDCTDSSTPKQLGDPLNLNGAFRARGEIS